MIAFGPSGNADSFYEAGFKSTLEAPQYLKSLGLNAYEYSFGRGINLSQEMAEKIGAAMAAEGILLSVHAPYYINLANPDPEKRQTSLNYILESALRAQWMGAERIVVHVGSPMKMARGDAMQNCREGLKSAEAIRRKWLIASAYLPGMYGQKGANRQSGRNPCLLPAGRKVHSLSGFCPYPRLGSGTAEYGRRFCKSSKHR